MPIYVVIATSDSLDEAIGGRFDQASRIQASQGVWFVRSPRLSSEEVAEDIGISVGKLSGIVVTAKHYSGVAAGAIVEKLSVWEQET